MPGYITEPEIAKVMREGLVNLYSVIKDHDRHIKFVFLTGVSKFSTTKRQIVGFFTERQLAISQ